MTTKSKEIEKAEVLEELRKIKKSLKPLSKNDIIKLYIDLCIRHAQLQQVAQVQHERLKPTEESEDVKDLDDSITS